MKPAIPQGICALAFVFVALGVPGIRDPSKINRFIVFTSSA
jgi:hypothetical protein